MNITNGSVTRAYKVADYETRTVSFSFTFDEGEDVDAGTKKAVLLAERHARMAPEPKVEPKKEARVEPKVNPTETPSSPNQTDSLSAPGTEGSTPSEEVDTSNEALQKLCAWATKTTGDHEMVKATVKEFSPTPPHKIASMPGDNRAAFVAALKSKVNG